MFKHWIRNFFIFSFLITFLFSGFNYICDPYGIFGNDWSGNTIRNHTASDRMSKTYYAKRMMPQTILIGTSRMGILNPKDVENHTKDKVYNMAMSGASIYEQSMYAQFAIETLHVKQIIWGIDFFSFNPEAMQHFSFSKERLTETLYLKDYHEGLLSLDAFFASFQTLSDSLLSQKKAKVDFKIGHDTYAEFKTLLSTQGLSFIDGKIEKGLQGYASKKELFNSELFKNPHSIDANFTLIKDIFLLARQHDVKIIFYISPTYHEHLNLIYALGLENSYNAFTTKLSELSPYWNFNTNNSITKDKNNFWDNSHMREEIGTLVINKIFQQDAPIEPFDFGIFVKSKQE